MTDALDDFLAALKRDDARHSDPGLVRRRLTELVEILRADAAERRAAEAPKLPEPTA